MFPSNHRSNGGGAYLALDSSLLLVGCEDDAHEGRSLIRKPKPAVLVVDKDGDDIDRLVRVSLVVGQRKAHNSLDALDPRCRSEFVVRPVFHLREYGPQVRRRGGQLLEFHLTLSFEFAVYGIRPRVELELPAAFFTAWAVASCDAASFASRSR